MQATDWLVASDKKAPFRKCETGLLIGLEIPSECEEDPSPPYARLRMMPTLSGSLQQCDRPAFGEALARYANDILAGREIGAVDRERLVCVRFHRRVE